MITGVNVIILSYKIKLQASFITLRILSVDPPPNAKDKAAEDHHEKTVRQIFAGKTITLANNILFNDGITKLQLNMWTLDVSLIHFIEIM